MKTKKSAVIAVVIILILAVVITAAALIKRKQSSRQIPDEMQTEEKDLQAFEDTGEVYGEEEPEEEEEEADELPEISPEDADVLIAEKLKGKPCSPNYNEIHEVDGRNYYTYTVLDANEEEMDQLLAVDAISGEVFVYDLDNNAVFDFSTFELYNSESDEAVSWEGSFVNGDSTLDIEPVEDDAFEFTLKKGNNTRLGVANSKGREARYENGAESITFRRTADGIEVEGSADLAGSYKKQ